MDSTVTSSGVRYWTYNASKQPTIVMIHGFTGSHEGFQYIVPNLPEFRIIIPDLPGFGESKLPEKPWTIDALARSTNAFVASLGLDHPPFLISHSLGGLIAASMLSQNPELFAKDTVFISPVATKIGILDSRRVGAMLGRTQYLIGKSIPKFGPKLVKNRALSRFTTDLMMTTKHPELKKKIYNHHYKNLDYIASIDFYHRLYVDITKHGVMDYAGRLGQLNVLVIAGDKDVVTPFKAEQSLAQKLSAKLVPIYGVGHLAHYEKPRKIAQAVADFLL